MQVNGKKIVIMTIQVNLVPLGLVCAAQPGTWTSGKKCYWIPTKAQMNLDCRGPNIH